MIHRMTRETTRGETLEVRSAERKLVSGSGDVVRRDRRYNLQSGILERQNFEDAEVRNKNRKIIAAKINVEKEQLGEFMVSR